MRAPPACSIRSMFLARVRRMKTYFYDLFERASNNLRRNEVLLANFSGENSDFVRINRSRIRQAGSVYQLELSLELINAGQHAEARTNISGAIDADTSRVNDIITDLRAQYALLPDDPFLVINQTVKNSHTVNENRLPKSSEVIRYIVENTQDLDMVGLYTSGTVYRGFANSLGQRNWYQKPSFNLDWSCFLSNNAAAKSACTGFSWNIDNFSANVDQMHDQLAILEKPPKTIKPGQYRVYLAPTALREIMSTLAWQSFGAKAHKTRQTPLLKLAEQKLKLDKRVRLIENNVGGNAPGFTVSGFIKPPQVGLIEHGKHAGFLINSRSAKEYNLEVNAGSEYPLSLDLAGGELNGKDILNALDKGLYINNLWYSNFSDPNHCKITGMTRYACFWVENGQLTAPITPMRFDESVYDMLGPNLLNLTRDRQWILETDTYERRSVASMRVPGLLVNRFNLTL